MASRKKNYLKLPADGRGGYLLSPFGSFGRCYQVPDQAAYDQLNGKWQSDGACLSLIPSLCSTLSGFAGKHGEWASWGLLAMAFTYCAAYAVWVQRLTRPFPVYSERPPFKVGFRQCAYSSKPIALWITQLICLALAAVFAEFARRALYSPIDGGISDFITSSIACGLFVAVAVLCLSMNLIRSARCAIAR